MTETGKQITQDAPGFIDHGSIKALFINTATDVHVRLRWSFCPFNIYKSSLQLVRKCGERPGPVLCSEIGNFSKRLNHLPHQIHTLTQFSDSVLYFHKYGQMNTTKYGETSWFF